MTDQIGDEQDGRPLTRREARDATPSDGVPLGDGAFPTFDQAAVPPRPPLPAEQSPVGDAASLGDDTHAIPVVASSVSIEPADALIATADHNAIREQWRVARTELESHVSHARDQLDQANERIKQRTGRDLIVAILIGLAFGALLLSSIIFIKWLFVPIALAGGLLGTYELARAMRSAGRRIDIVPQLIAGSLLIFAGAFADIWLSWVTLFVSVAFVVVWRLMAQMVAKDGRLYGEVLADALISGLVQIYVPFLASIALILLNQEGGQWWVLGFIAVAVAADTGAYAAGVAFGKHPMAPRISPKKTWEGFAGAVAASVAVGVLLALFLLELPWWGGAIIGIAILLSATLGDLAESMLKRDLGIKDMSSWLPGHGGLLDRLDSILPSTVPALSLYFLLSPWAVL